MTTKTWAELYAESGTASQQFEVLPVGTYPCVVDSAEATRATTGREMLKVKFKVVEGHPNAGRTIYNNIVLVEDNPTAMSIFFRHMRAMGISEAFWANNPPFSQIAVAIAGQQCKVSIKHREYNGAMQPDVTNIAPPDGGTPLGGGAGGGAAVPPPPIPRAAAPATPPPPPVAAAAAPPVPAAPPAPPAAAAPVPPAPPVPPAAPAAPTPPPPPF